MVVILSTILSCSQAFGLVNKITSIAALTPQQRLDIIQEVRKVVPSCPVTIQKDVPKQTSTSN